MKKFFRFIFSKLFIINIIIAAIILVSAFFIIKIYIHNYSNHGQTQKVPNLIGLQIKEIEEICKKQNLNFVISDSIYNNYFDKGAVVEQFPAPQFEVKAGRTIYLIRNCIEDEMIEMPQLVGFSIRQVKSLASTYGIEIGNLNYIPDIAVNVVIRQYLNGEQIVPGTRIPKGSVIDLYVGLGMSDRKTVVPNIIGLKYKEASNFLLEEYLNIGAVRYDETVKNKEDSTNAKIFKQSPISSTINMVNLGYNIDIWLTIDEEIIDVDK